MVSVLDVCAASRVGCCVKRGGGSLVGVRLSSSHQITETKKHSPDTGARARTINKILDTSNTNSN